MQGYVTALDQVAPGWERGAAVSSPSGKKGGAAGMSTAGAVSTMGQISGPGQGDIDETPIGKLCELVAKGDIDDVQQVLTKKRDMAFQVDKDGMAPLHWAADRNHLGILKLLLSLVGEDAAVAKTRLNMRDQNGDTPLHYAVLSESAEAATLLLQLGADAHLENEDGETPATLAADWSSAPEALLAAS
jgi:ankyrin repeat protein